MAVFGRSYPIKPIIAPVKLTSGKNIAGVVSNVSVSAPAGSIAIYQNNNPQQPFSPQLPPSLQFAPQSYVLRQQYNTASPDVFVTGSVANVNVVAQAGTVNDFIDGTGQAGNVNVVAQPGTVTIYQIVFPQFPVLPILPAPLKFIPPYIGLRQQVSTALPDVFVPGSAANVNVSGPSGTVTELIDGVGATANINAVANPGGLLITAPNPPNFAFLPLSPFRYVPSLSSLRQQYNTALPDVFEPSATANVNVTAQFADETVAESVVGTVSNVNVVAQPGSISIYQIENQPFPFSPILPVELQFNPAYKTLRQQYNTGIPIPLAGVPGSVANVNVSGQSDNSILETLSGTASNVNVAAPAGIVTIYTEVFPTFPQPPILPRVLQFNPAYLTLRQQYNAALPDVFVTGSTANVNVSAQNGTITESVSTTINVAVASPSDESVTVAVTGPVSNISVSSTGATVNSVQGNSASVNVVANPPFPPIDGPTVQVIVSAPAGSLRYINNTTWWRVYRGYANWPTW